MNRRKFLQAMSIWLTVFLGQSSVIAAQRLILNPTLSPYSRKKARAIGKNLIRSKKINFFSLDKLVASTSQSDIMKTLFVVFRESIRQTNDDKRYFLGKLKMYNDVAQAMGDFIKELNDAAGLNRSGVNKKDKCTRPKAIVKTYELEEILDNLELKVKQLPRKARVKPDVKSLRISLIRDRKLIQKARKIYKSL